VAGKVPKVSALSYVDLKKQGGPDLPGQDKKMVEQA
jgi:hypothetical protein